MRMKEVCERTGLTDRAVRLYIENGLVAPKEERNYAGRRTIVFDEDDVKVLEAVATLRKADFSISDILKMKTYPEKVADTVEKHCVDMAEEIENKQKILQTLNACKTKGFDSYLDVAEKIRSSASEKSLPKEDSGVNWDKIKCIVVRRISAILAFVLLLIGLLNIGGLVCNMAFSKTHLVSGGGYELSYSVTAEAFGQHIVALLAVLVLFFAVAAVVCHLFGGRKVWLGVSVIFAGLSVVLLLCIPGADAERIYFFEFIAFRNALINTPFYNPRAVSEWVISLIKYLPVVAGAILSVVGCFAASGTEQED